MAKEEIKTASIGCKCKTIKINMETKDTSKKEEIDLREKFPPSDKNKV